MNVKALAFLFCVCCPLFAQTNTTIFITDSNGNQTAGNLGNGNLFLYDSKGNQVLGTIRNGFVT